MESTMTLTGYVGQDIELRQTRTGISTVSFRVGTTPRIKTADGWTDGTTTWVNVTCYRYLADNVGRCVSKGDPVIVHGRVRTQMWTDAGGINHERMVIEASSVGHDLNRGMSAFTRTSTKALDYSGPEEDTEESPCQEEGDRLSEPCAS